MEKRKPSEKDGFFLSFCIVNIASKFRQNQVATLLSHTQHQNKDEMKNIMTILFIFMFFSGVFAQKITEVRKEDLPETIVKYVSKNIKGATIFKAVKLDDKGTKTYNVAIDIHGHKHIYVFDKAGKFLKKGDDLVNSAKKPVKNLP
jgi:hypothetical protein